MKKLIALALVVGCLGVVASVAMAATRSIKVGDNYYVRSHGVPVVTVSKGPAKFNSGVRSGGTFKKKVTKRGTYTIYCTIHGASDQKMKLKVK